MFYGKVGYLCYFVYNLCVMGKWVAHLIRFRASVLLESRLLFYWVLPPMCYGQVGCSFDWDCCMFVMGKSVAYLNRVVACVL